MARVALHPMIRNVCLCLSVVSVLGCSRGRVDPPVPTPVTPSPTVPVRVEDAVEFGRVGVRGTFDVTEITHIGASFLRLPVPLNPDPSSNPGALSAQISGPDGGVASYTWQDSQLDGRVSTGDVLTINYSGYIDDAFKLDGTMTIDSLSTLGVLTQSGGTWIADATLRAAGLQFELGSASYTIDADFGFRLESREQMEIFDVALFDDVYFGADELKSGCVWIRYESLDQISYNSAGHAYSPALDGVVAFQAVSLLFLKPFTSRPISGDVIIFGAGPCYVEVETQLPVNLGCTLPFPGLTCPVDLRVESDGVEGYEATTLMSFTDFMPQ